jgi:hypothetical protein
MRKIKDIVSLRLFLIILKVILTIKKNYLFRLEHVMLVIIVLELSYTFVLELSFKVLEFKLYLLESSGI